MSLDDSARRTGLLRRPSRTPAFAALLVMLMTCGPVLALAAPQGQEPGKKPPDKPAANDDLLRAEREKLRMKDVEAWKKLQVKSLDQVMDVKKMTKPIDYPATVTDEEKAKMADLLKKAKDGGGGARTGRALRELEKMGHPALIFLVNQLREIDYKDPTDAMFGMQLNLSLQNMTMGINTGYVAVEIGEQMDPRKAQWNAMTVQQWQDGVRTWWPTKEKFDDFIAKRKAKKDAELEEEEGGKPEGGKEEGGKEKKPPAPAPKAGGK